MHTVRLLLETTEYDKHVINKRFHALSHIHNVLVKHAKKQMKKLYHDEAYLALKEEFAPLRKKDKLSEAEEARMKELKKMMAVIVKSYEISEYDFQSYIKVCGKRHRKLLSSQQIQKEASRVWVGVRKVVFGDGKEIHFKKFRDFDTISGKTNTNGVKFSKTDYSIDWLGLHIMCKLPKDIDYFREAINHDISYCEIERKMFPNGWHYYVIVYLKGDAPKKLKKSGSPDNITGLDIGTSTVASVSENKATLRELAPRANEYNRKIQKLQKSLDASKRQSNPDKYNDDGTIRKGNRDRWKYTKTYLKKRDMLKSLYRQKSAYIKQCHEELANELIENSVNFVVEAMSFKGLQKKSKKTERQEQTSEVTQKDGMKKEVHKYKRKKRFGKSLNNRAPATFLSILARKAKQYGGSLVKVNTKEFKASQYNHVTDECVKMKLSDRIKTVGDHEIQRDLYSAFLLRNTSEDLKSPDRGKCINGFDSFISLHDSLISGMKADGVSMKQCFGF